MNDCILSMIGLTRKGYSQKSIKGKKFYAHRLAYISAKGKIPEGLVIDHLCGVKNCINPSHLEAVTNIENLTRAGCWNGGKTHCKKGHAFDERNTRYDLKRNKRVCRKCSVIASTIYQRGIKAKI